MLPTRRLLYTTLAVSRGASALKPPTTRARTMSALCRDDQHRLQQGWCLRPPRGQAPHRRPSRLRQAATLHVALACPWAAGALSMLYLKGLEDAISLSIVHPTWQRTRPDDPEDQHCGWVYRAPGRRAALQPARPRLL